MEIFLYKNSPNDGVQVFIVFDSPFPSGPIQEA